MTRDLFLHFKVRLCKKKLRNFLIFKKDVLFRFRIKYNNDQLQIQLHKKILQTRNLMKIVRKHPRHLLAFTEENYSIILLFFSFLTFLILNFIAVYLGEYWIIKYIRCKFLVQKLWNKEEIIMNFWHFFVCSLREQWSLLLIKPSSNYSRIFYGDQCGVFFRHHWTYSWMRCGWKLGG